MSIKLVVPNNSTNFRQVEAWVSPCVTHEYEDFDDWDWRQVNLDEETIHGLVKIATIEHMGFYM